jgi:hypothetical protein
MLASLLGLDGQTKPWKQMELPSAHFCHQIFTVEISKLTPAMPLDQMVWQDGIK